MHYLNRSILLGFLCFFASTTTTASDLYKNFGGQSYTFVDYTYQSVPGRLYVPDAHDGIKAMPLVTFLHGLGEKGSDNSRQVNGNMANLAIQANARDFLFFVPQSSGGWWAESHAVAEAVGQISIDYKIDPNRVYLTGLSAGGAGTMKSLREYDTLYAGYVPLSVAGSHFNSAADAAAGVGRPTWYFSGWSDTPFRFNNQTSLSSTLAAAGVNPADLPSYPTSAADYDYINSAANLRLTEFGNGGHNNNTWNNGAYARADLYDWLLGQTNQMTTPQPNGETLRFSFQQAVAGGEAPHGVTDSLGRVWNAPQGYRAQAVEGILQTFARNESGARTTVTLEMTNGFYSSGTTTLSASADMEDATGYWRLYRYQDTDAQLVFHGLTAGGVYDMGLFASIATTNQTDYQGLYSVGDSSLLINAANNDAMNYLAGLIADGDGQLVLDIALLRDAGGNILSTNALLNAITITAVPEPGGLALAIVGVTWLLTRRRRT